MREITKEKIRYSQAQGTLNYAYGVGKISKWAWKKGSWYNRRNFRKRTGKRAPKYNGKYKIRR